MFHVWYGEWNSCYPNPTQVRWYWYLGIVLDISQGISVNNFLRRGTVLNLFYFCPIGKCCNNFMFPLQWRWRAYRRLQYFAVQYRWDPERFTSWTGSCQSKYCRLIDLHLLHVLSALIRSWHVSTALSLLSISLDHADDNDMVIVLGDYNFPNLNSYLTANASSEQKITLTQSILGKGLSQVNNLLNSNSRLSDLLYLWTILC